MWNLVRAVRNCAARTGHELPWVCAAAGWPLRTNEKRLRSLRHRETGKRIFILGGGPSLNRTDVDRLCNEVTIASNAIFLLFERKAFRPTYFTIEDSLMAQDRGREAAAKVNSWKIFPEDMRRFIPADERTCYVNFIRHYEGFPRFSDDFVRRVYWGGTVTFLNMQLAWFLGAARIYLIGFDHYYAPPRPNDRVQGSVITSAAEDVNHFDPRYFGPGYRWHDPQVERMEAAYRVAREFFAARGIPVFNATAGGRLEVFPRVDFDSLF
jgi:hypothetical protein